MYFLDQNLEMEHVLLLLNVTRKEELLVETVLLGKRTESSINAALLRYQKNCISWEHSAVFYIIKLGLLGVSISKVVAYFSILKLAQTMLK